MRKDEISSKADKDEDEEEGELKTTTTRKRLSKDASVTMAVKTNTQE